MVGNHPKLPFWLHVDWTLWDIDESPVRIEIQHPGNHCVLLRCEPDPIQAAQWCKAYLRNRGLRWDHDLDDPNRQRATRLTMTAKPGPHPSYLRTIVKGKG